MILIFCVDPRQGAEKNLFGYAEIMHYKQFFPKTKIVQRVGDVGTHGKPDLTKLLCTSIQKSDVAIFPSEWAYEYMSQEMHVADKSRWHIIKNAPMSCFYKHRKKVQEIQKINEINFVTHHWSTNSLKGFDFYQLLDKHFQKKFSYIGRMPHDMKFYNSQIISPLNEVELSNELPKYDVYVSASKLEAGANHVLEAIACGLPVIYHKDGGSIIEYCRDFGFQFDGTISSFNDALYNLFIHQKNINNNISNYKRSVFDLANEYTVIIENLYEQT